MSGSNPQRGIPQTGIGPNVTGTQAYLAKQGLVASMPWINDDGTLNAGSFRLLLNILTQINGLQRGVTTLEDAVITLQNRLTAAGL